MAPQISAVFNNNFYLFGIFENGKYGAKCAPYLQRRRWRWSFILGRCRVGNASIIVTRGRRSIPADSHVLSHRRTRCRVRLMANPSRNSFLSDDIDEGPDRGRLSSSSLRSLARSRGWLGGAPFLIGRPRHDKCYLSIVLIDLYRNDKHSIYAHSNFESFPIIISIHFEWFQMGNCSPAPPSDAAFRLHYVTIYISIILI